MQNLLVTHSNPDLDAVAGVWLFKRFMAGWENAELAFVPAGETYKGDGNYAHIVHVDTGMGEFDHHQDNADTCAAKKIFEYLQTYRKDGRDAPYGKVKSFNIEALTRMVAVINDFDHFRQVYFPEANADYFQFSLDDILDGLNSVFHDTGSGDVEKVSFGMTALDGILRVFQNKVAAEREIDEGQKIEVETRYGKAIGIETSNDAVLDIAQKQGYCITVRKDPRKAYVRVKSLPDKNIDLTPLYERMKKEDPEATWFLHASRAMLLNGSTKNPKMKPSSLALEQIMQFVKEL